MDRLNERLQNADWRDWTAMAGLALVAAGLLFVWWPLALIVPGAMLIAIALLAAVK